MTDNEEITVIKQALESLIAAILKHDDDRDRADRRPITITPFSGIMAADLPTRDLSSMIELAEDPVGESLRRSVRQMGKRLHTLGGLDLMQTVADEVADSDPNQFSRRINIMDKRWDMIGETDPSTGAFLGWAA